MVGMNDMKFYTVNEVAKILHLSPRTIRRKIKDGKIFAMKLGDTEKSPVRIRDAELERLIINGYKIKDIP